MKFTWEDVVITRSDAPQRFRPNQGGVVVGFYRIESEGAAAASGCLVGTVLYTVEFPDGSDAEVPEDFLVAVPE